MPKNPIGGEGFLQAMPHERALRFPGAADYKYAKDFFVERGMPALRPCQEILTQYEDLIRAARTEDEVFLYVPTSAPLTLNGDWSGYTATALDLAEGKSLPLAMKASGNATRLEMAPVLEDALILLKSDREE